MDQPNPSSAPPEAVASMQSIILNLMEQKFAEPFLEPVDWKAWGLFDYPEVIKNPMDLGTIEGKIKRGEYPTFEAFRKDVQLVIDNCTTYNDKKSEVYKQAIKLQKFFDKELIKQKTSSGTGGSSERGADKSGSGAIQVVRSKAPTSEEKDKFCKLIFQLKAADLGRVVELIDELCPNVIERTGRDEIDINVDTIDTASYRKLEALARELASNQKDGGGAMNKRKRGRTDGNPDEEDDEAGEA